MSAYRDANNNKNYSIRLTKRNSSHTHTSNQAGQMKKEEKKFKRSRRQVK